MGSGSVRGPGDPAGPVVERELRGAQLRRASTSNSDAKGDRLRIATMAERYEAAQPEPETAPVPAAFALASASTTTVEFAQPAPKEPTARPSLKPSRALNRAPNAQAGRRAKARRAAAAVARRRPDLRRCVPA